MTMRGHRALRGATDTRSSASLARCMAARGTSGCSLGVAVQPDLCSGIIWVLPFGGRFHWAPLEPNFISGVMPINIIPGGPPPSPLIGFIDAGYLKAGGARSLGVGSTDVTVDAAGVVSWLRGAAGFGGSFLRAYWYEGAFDGGDARYASQRTYLDAVALTAGIQLRLGHVQERPTSWHHAVKQAAKAAGADVVEFERRFRFRPELEQKGVDTLIVLDLVRLAQRRAYAIAVLVAGDRDLAEAVRVAQDEGCRVILAHPAQAGVATELRQLADQVHAIDATALATMVRRRGKKGA